MRSIYLDNNATTFLHPQVLEAMQRAERDGLANPASQHYAGRRARKLLEEAREGIVEILGGEVGTMRADRLIFTSGGTEANNLALFGMGAAAAEKGSKTRRVIVSAIEHPSVLRAAEQLQRRGWSVVHAPVDQQGQVDVDRFAQLLSEPTSLAAVMLANHETGVLQPMEAIAERCAAAGVPLHTDAIQAVGKIAVDFRRLNVASLSVAAHKFHGPVGIGALLTRHDTPLEPHLFGGFQQAGLRQWVERTVARAAGDGASGRGGRSLDSTEFERFHDRGRDRRGGSSHPFVYQSLTASEFRWKIGPNTFLKRAKSAIILGLARKSARRDFSRTVDRA
jgi:cysteine desulfurase